MPAERMEESEEIMAETNPDARTASFRATLQTFAYNGSPTKRPGSPDLDDRSPRRITRSSSKASTPQQDAQKLPDPLKPGSSRSSAGSTSLPARQTPSKQPLPSASPRPKLKKKSSSGYAPPSRYAHVSNLLADALAPDLICVFIGVNPGIMTAQTGHAYAHPSNLFWKLLHSSGCTPRRCLPSETYALPQLYGLGNTNIVARATGNAAELSRQEMDDGVSVLEEKVRKYRPESVAIVGKGIWESIWRVRHGKAITKDQFHYGWQDDPEKMGKPIDSEGDSSWTGAQVFVATSTSGLAAGLKPHEKEEIWRQLGEKVEQRRMEKGLVGDRRLVEGAVLEND